jgi:putative transposase
MPSPRPAFFPGGYYHLYNRGSSKLDIFLEPENYSFVLRLIQQYLPQLQLSLLAYCLLPNHYHFLIRQDGACPPGMLSQRVFNSYSKAFNKRYRHSGTLFEGPYRIKPVLEDSYLLHLCRYIHANPVKHGLAEHPGRWPYSNYAEWVGERPDTLLDRKFIDQNFSSAGDYAQFVLEYITTRRLPARVVEHLRGIEA